MSWSSWQESVTALGGSHKILSTYARIYQEVETVLEGRSIRADKGGALLAQG